MFTADVARVPATSRFTAFAWAILIYTILVVLWGALVRATGSGAGCGAHWPLCNGQVVPVFPQLHTAIEFTHRVTSGLALVGVAALYVWARRSFVPGSALRRTAFWALVFMMNEALIGAWLVLSGLVAGNRSPWRAVVLAFHLTNTLLLVGSLALAAWWSAHPVSGLGASPLRRRILYALIAVILTSAAGGVAALGDTLFPAQTLAGGVGDEFARSAPLLVRLRMLHPVLALLAGGYLMALAMRGRRLVPDEHVARWSTAIVGLTLAQFALGGVNILLLTPVWTQITHLLLTDLLWVSLVVFAAALSAAGARR